jgi:hypothetical protein
MNREHMSTLNNHLVYTMKLSSETIQILKNFANINQSVILDAGTRIRTISVTKTILAEADIIEEFPVDVAIYDLPQFLNSVNLIDDADLSFGPESVLISNGKSNIEYRYSDPRVVTAPPKGRSLSLQTEDVSFTLLGETLQKLLKASAVLQLPDMALRGREGVLFFELYDKKQNTSSNKFRVDVGSVEDDNDFDFRIENLKILPGDYEVVVSKNSFARFEHASIPVVYFVALEKK